MTPNRTSGDDVEAERRAEEEMARFGITRVPVTYFHFGNFKYTRLEDALAQARRATPGMPPDDRAATRLDKGDKSEATGGRGTRRKDQPGCGVNGKNIVEGAYTP